MGWAGIGAENLTREDLYNAGITTKLAVGETGDLLPFFSKIGLGGHTFNSW